jgi:uncharacterized protein involved in exopolysaccharide biosynthesis
MYEPSNRDSALALEETLKELRRAVSVSLSAKTGIVYTAVTAPEASVAQQINQRLLQLADSFNRSARRGQALSERQFAEGRLSEAADNLRAAEDRLQSFLQGNLQYRNSPVLVFQYDRLSREVASRQMLYSSLAQAYEQARIEEVRDTPVFGILEAPTLASHPDSRHLVRNTLLALIIGSMVGMIVGVVIKSSNESSQFAADIDEFQYLKGAVLREIRRPWTFFRN